MVAKGEATIDKDTLRIEAEIIIIEIIIIKAGLIIIIIIIEGVGLKCKIENRNKDGISNKMDRNNKI